MAADPNDQIVLNGILELLNRRKNQYKAGVKTTLLGNLNGVWQNLLTKLEFICEDDDVLDATIHRYPEVVIVRRLLSSDQARSLPSV